MSERVRTIVWFVILLLGVTLSAVQIAEDELHPQHAPGLHEHGAQHEPKRLFQWEPDQAQTLWLRAQDGYEHSFVRTAGGWEASSTSAPGGRGDEFDPEAYVALLSQARMDRAIPADESALRDFGLAPAVMSVHVQDSAGAPLADISVGALTPDGFGRYVMMPPETRVLIVPNYQFDKAIGSLLGTP